jgi:hypothetical protein
VVNVSAKWKAAHERTLLPETFVEITYNVTDPGVQADAESAGTPEEKFSNAESVVLESRDSETKYATLEHNQWILDKTFKALPSSPPLADGFISSNLSGADGGFAAVPTITITFGEVHANYVPGITVVWSKAYNEYARRFRVTAYNGSTQVATTTVENNTAVTSIVWLALAGYNKIVVEILEWCLPYRRARTLECLIGIKQTYTKADLMGFTHEQSVDLLSGALPKNSIVFQLDNADNRWNPENPSGSEQYLIRRQTLKVRYGLLIDDEIEWIKAGTFYMSEWNTPANGMTATFTARDVLEFCTDTYTGPRSGSLYSLAVAALRQSGVEMGSVVLSPTLKNIQTEATEDTAENTCLDILQMVANAGQCCMWQDRDGVLHIEPLNTTLSDYVIGTFESGFTNTYDHPEITLSKELKSVRVNDGQGMAHNSDTGVVQEVSNPLIVDANTANAVAEWCRDCLKGRKTITGTFRADPRLDALDKVTVVSKYSSAPVYVTNIKYDYNGAFKGSYEGRVAE